MIKLIATDIDGTILIPEGKFTEGVKACIKELDESGVKVVLVTGRMNKSAQQIADELNLKTPIVSYQGGLMTEGDKILYEKYLTEEQSERILDWAESEKVHINLYNNDTLYSEDDGYEITRYCSNQHVPYTVADFRKLKKDRVNKLLAIDYDNPDRIGKYEKELPEIFPELYIVRSTPCFLEFSNKGGSKYCAVRYLQKYWGIDESETLTIGDQNNDIELLKAGGVKVAMGNATEELKMRADYVTDTVFEDGFVKAINKFCK